MRASNEGRQVGATKEDGHGGIHVFDEMDVIEPKRQRSKVGAHLLDRKVERLRHVVAKSDVVARWVETGRDIGGDQ